MLFCERNPRKGQRLNMSRVLRFLTNFFPVLLLIQAYAAVKFYHAFQAVSGVSSETLKVIIFSVVSYVDLYVVCLISFRLSGAQEAAHKMASGSWLWDFFLAYPFWFSFVFVVETLPWLLLIEFAKFPLYPFYLRVHDAWLLVENSLVLAVFIFYFCFILVRVVLDTRSVRVSTIVYKQPGLSSLVNGLRIAHISDLHADNRTHGRKLRRFIASVNALAPDIVFFTGDLVSSNGEYIFDAATVLGKIRSRYGVFACVGDHDFGNGNQNVVVSLNENGIKVLQDINEIVNAGRAQLFVTFITNVYSQRPSLDKLQFLMGAQPRGALDILVTHQPTETIVDLAAEHGYHLCLAGHTHGGQVNFKPFGLLFSAAQIETRFFKGVYRVGQMLVNVSSGLGFTNVPLRYRAPAEISIIQIGRGTDGES